MMWTRAALIVTVIISLMIAGGGYMMAGPYFFKALFYFEEPLWSLLFLLGLLSPALVLLRLFIQNR